ncbi:hypothetical protein DV515_00003749 [Chloebia gouldiae]|uniref:Uncharacterized protein n=1 Tax=Chloebia gouldiae TaxID=44316 RepID=A0A3L8SST3_CHLGU|nr:hypothetical protein DV515_00003749 [Chloebia gouldiae]
MLPESQIISNVSGLDPVLLAAAPDICSVSSVVFQPPLSTQAMKTARSLSSSTSALKEEDAILPICMGRVHAKHVHKKLSFTISMHDGKNQDILSGQKNPPIQQAQMLPSSGNGMCGSEIAQGRKEVISYAACREFCDRAVAITFCSILQATSVLPSGLLILSPSWQLLPRQCMSKYLWYSRLISSQKGRQGWLPSSSEIAIGNGVAHERSGPSPGP